MITAESTRLDGATIAHQAFVLRFVGTDQDRLLVINLGCDLDPSPVPEPLLAPPGGCQWRLLWSSESVAYGGSGTPATNPNARWHIPGESAVLFGSEPQSLDDGAK